MKPLMTIPASIRLPLRKLLIEERETASCSSSEADELEGVPSGTYCVWTPKAAESPPGRCRKSNSTGSSKLIANHNAEISSLQPPSPNLPPQSRADCSPISDLDFWLNTFMLHFLVSSCVSSLPINFTNQFYSLVGFLVEYIHAAFYWKYLLFAETL